MGNRVDDLAVAKRMVATKESASARNISYGMSFKRTKKLMQQKTCFYTGVPFTETNKVTFDRVENDLGYTDDNVVGCTKRINNLKDNLTLEELKGLCRGIERVKKRNQKAKRTTK